MTSLDGFDVEMALSHIMPKSNKAELTQSNIQKLRLLNSAKAVRRQSKDNSCDILSHPPSTRKMIHSISQLCGWWERSREKRIRVEQCHVYMFGSDSTKPYRSFHLPYSCRATTETSIIFYSSRISDVWCQMHRIQIDKKLRCFLLVFIHFDEPTVNCCKILMASMGFDVNAWGDIRTPERTYDRRRVDNHSKN